jgi:hypothetical protein
MNDSETHDKPSPFALSLSKGPCIVSLSNGLSLSKGWYGGIRWLRQAQPERCVL